jgi:hypothetical protein
MGDAGVSELFEVIQHLFAESLLLIAELGIFVFQVFRRFFRPRWAMTL